MEVLGYPYGGLVGVDQQEALARIVSHVRHVRLQVLLTSDPFGAYGHPDHIAVSQFATAASVAWADPEFGAGEGRDPTGSP